MQHETSNARGNQTAYGGTVIKIDTRAFRASQYNHETDGYELIPLKQRHKEIGMHTVQRDLYGAFRIRNTDDTLTHADRNKCIYGFPKYDEVTISYYCK